MHYFKHLRVSIIYKLNIQAQIEQPEILARQVTSVFVGLGKDNIIEYPHLRLDED